jgi:3-oxoacyl-[acyl-carrier-protein] synthase II
VTHCAQRRRVVVTGLGVVSPVGNTVQEAWASLVAGRSGIAAITRFNASALTTRFASQVKNFNVEAYILPKDAPLQLTSDDFGRHMRLMHRLVRHKEVRTL